jgi:hypothetical protein
MDPEAIGPPAIEYDGAGPEQAPEGASLASIEAEASFDAPFDIERGLGGRQAPAPFDGERETSIADAA